MIFKTVATAPIQRVCSQQFFFACFAATEQNEREIGIIDVWKQASRLRVSCESNLWLNVRQMKIADFDEIYDINRKKKHKRAVK